MKLAVVDRDLDRPVEDDWLVRVAGWTWKRWIHETPEMAFCEFERGDILMHAVGPEHQDAVRFLTFLLTAFCARHRRGKVLNGPAAVRTSPGVGREPDIFIVPPGQRIRVRDRVCYVVPLLVVEVISPSTRALDLHTKAAEYAALGVQEYWAVDVPARDWHVHVLARGRYRSRTLSRGKLASVALPGFWVRVGWLWRDPLPPEPDCWDEIERAVKR